MSSSQDPTSKEKRLFQGFDQILFGKGSLDRFDQELKTVLDQYEYKPDSYQNTFKLVNEIGSKRLDDKGLEALQNLRLSEQELAAATNLFMHLLAKPDELEVYLTTPSSYIYTAPGEPLFDDGLPVEFYVGEVRFEKLVTWNDLNSETLSMQHAIKDLSNKFTAGEWVGFKMSGPGNDRSTVAFDLKEGEAVSVNTHTAIANAEPSPLHTACAEQAITDLETACSTTARI